MTSSHEDIKEILGVEIQTDMSATQVEEMHQEISALYYVMFMLSYLYWDNH